MPSSTTLERALHLELCERRRQIELDDDVIRIAGA